VAAGVKDDEAKEATQSQIRPSVGMLGFYFKTLICCRVYTARTTAVCQAWQRKSLRHSFTVSSKGGLSQRVSRW